MSEKRTNTNLFVTKTSANRADLVSFCSLLAQHKVNDGGDKRETEGDPCQDEAVTVVTILIDVEAVCVDGGCDHDAHAGQELKDAGDCEPLSFGEGEELSRKHKNSNSGEYACKHRAGLHRMEIICWVV